MNLAAIELHLLHAGGFVPARELCDRFQISDARQLRADKGRPGPLDDFAVSSTRDGQHGFTHQRYSASGPLVFQKPELFPGRQPWHLRDIPHKLLNRRVWFQGVQDGVNTSTQCPP